MANLIENQAVDLIPKDEIPFDVVKLPSKGLLYSSDHPFYKKENVEIKSMGTHEENILVSPALVKQGIVINVLLQSCIMNKAVDPTTLLMGDRAAILLAIRISGFGAEYKSSVFCKKCKNDYPKIFNLSESQIKSLTVNPITEGRNLFKYTLPSSKAEVHFSLPVDGDDLEVMKIQENRKKALVSAKIDTTISDRLRLAIKSINGKTDADYISSYIDTKMKVMDSRALRKYIQSIEPDVLLKQLATCTHCGATQEVSPSFGYNFLWPELD